MKTTFCILVILLCFISSVTAENYRVSASEISKLTDLLPGDSVIITSGDYANLRLKFSAHGSFSKPIVLTAEIAGKVVFTGSSTLLLSGKHITIQNLHFNDLKPIHSVSPIEMRTDSSTLKNCMITGFNTTPDDSTDNKWVSIYGKYNSVERCSFYEKKNIGCLLVVWLEEGIVPNHKILNNYFYRPTILRDPDGGKKNGQECVRIGTSHFSMFDAGCIVSGNTFYRCDSEIEVVSNKTCNNIFSNNLFLETQGALTLRHGNGALVEGNYFIGNNREGTAGIRVIGENQTIVNNYFENTKGIKYQSAICLIQGVKDSPLNRYFQVKNTKVVGNIINNCSWAITVSYGEADDQSLPVISTTISDNVIVNDNPNNVSFTWVDKPFAPDVLFNNNIVFGGQYNNFNKMLISEVNIKPSIEHMKKKWEQVREQSGAEWDNYNLN
jgi:poly(beta-D-mannuronate) lyase